VNKTQSWIAIALILSISACSNEPTDPAVETPDDNVNDPNKLWVTSERLEQRTCPSDKCGIVGQLYFREAATPLETKGEWVRITKRYDAACENDKSQYVDKGNAECVESNGIVDGKFAEWVRAKNLSKERPADPALTATADESLIADSDDFSKYRRQFSKLTANLIAEGRCTPDDFKEMGGWVKSVTNYRDEPVYFAYCGGMTVENKIYINAQTEEVLP
jgi:hypothetical protein